MNMAKQTGHIRRDLRRWGFCDRVKLIPKDVQWKNYFDDKFDNIEVNVDTEDLKHDIEETIQASVTEAVGSSVETAVENAVENNIDPKLCKIHKHIEDAKDHLCCDICCSKNEIIRHIDEKPDPVDFVEEFSNLNEQVAQINRKLDEMQN